MKIVCLCLAFVTLARHSWSACDRSTDINGCSIPNLPVLDLYRSVFKEACNRHDVCYQCISNFVQGRGLNVARRSCDLSFHEDMKIICLKRVWDFPVCIQYAGLYASAVLVAGASSYGRVTASYCRQGWVTECLPQRR